MRTLNPFRVVLENGMVVILSENHNAPVASIQIFVRAGSVHEGKYLGTGISHFVEHVVDDGTHRRSRQTIDELVEYIGNISNAYTWKDHTKYYITTSIADFDIALDVISDYIQNATFPKSEVEIQRGVILNEFNQDADESYRRLHDLYYETAYQKHPVRYPVGGYKELFEKLTRDDLVDFYVRTYAPQNIIFVAVGDFGIQEAFDKVRSAFKDFKPRPALNCVPLPEPKQLAMRRVQEYADVEITYMLMGFHTTDILNEDTYPLDLMASILSEGTHSRMDIAVKDQKQLVYSIGVWSEVPAYNVGLFMIESELEEECLELAKEAILQELYRLKSEPVSDMELQRAKAMEESAHIFSLQTAEECAAILGMNEFMTSDMNFSEKYLRKFQSVTAKDIMRVAKKYLNSENMTVAIIMPNRGTNMEHPPKGFRESHRDSFGTNSIGTKPEMLTSCANYQEIYANWTVGEYSISRESDKLKLGNLMQKGEYSSAPMPLSFPSSPQKIELKNGLRLLVQENHFMPIVSIQAMFLGGVFFETESNNGICNFMSNMLIRGTKRRTALQITEQIESIGGAIDGFSGNNSFGCALNLRSKDFKLGLDILADIIQRPAFDTEEFERQRREIIAEIKSDDDDLMSSAQKLFLQAMFGKMARGQNGRRATTSPFSPLIPNSEFRSHPYRFQPIGTLDTVSHLEREEVINFYQKHCVPNNMVLGIFGDIDSDEAIASASMYFSDFAKGDDVINSPVSCSPNYPYPLKENLIGVRRVEKNKDMAQAMLFIGYPGVTIFHEDRHIIQMLNGILSGVSYPGGRLHNRLRNDKCVYLIHAYNLFGLDTGYFAIYVSTTAEMLDAVVETIDEEIMNLRAHEVSVRELERGKRMCISNYQRNMQTISEQASNIGMDELYGLGYNYYLQYESKINSVTTANIKRVANQYLDPDRRVISILKPVQG